MNSWPINVVSLFHNTVHLINIELVHGGYFSPVPNFKERERKKRNNICESLSNKDFNSLQVGILVVY